MKKCLIIILGGILLLTIGSQSLHAYPTVTVVPSPNSKLSWGDTVKVAITFDLTDGTAKLGAYNLILTWDSKALDYKYTSGGHSQGYTTNNVNVANAQFGNITINQFFAAGTDGKVNVANVTFTAIGQHGSESAINVIVTELYDANDFSDLKKTLQIENSSVSMNAYPVISKYSLPDASERKLYKGYIIIEDPDSLDTCTVTILESPGWFKVNNTTATDTQVYFTGTPLRDDIGNDFPIIIRVEDAGGLADTLSTSINVIDVNEPPRFITTSLKGASEYTQYADTLLASDNDDGDILVFDKILGPEWLDLQRETGIISGLPGANADGGNVPVVFSVTDSKGLADTLSTQIYVKKVYNQGAYYLFDTNISSIGYQGGETIDNPGESKYIGVASYLFDVTRLRSFTIEMTWDKTKATYSPSRSGASIESDSYGINGIDTMNIPGEKNLLLADGGSITSIGEKNEEGYYSITWAKMGGEAVSNDVGLFYFAVFKTRSSEQFEIHFKARIYDDEGNEKTLEDKTVTINKKEYHVVGDFDSDGKIGPSDFSIFASHFNMTNNDNNPDWLPNCDFNNDGKITATDFSIFASRYGSTGNALKVASMASYLPSSDMNIAISEQESLSLNKNSVTISFNNPALFKGFEVFISYNINAYSLDIEQISGLVGLNICGFVDSGVLRISDWFVDEHFQGAVQLEFEKMAGMNEDLDFTILNAVIDGQNGIENVTDITRNSVTTPLQFGLLQNYPNPFNLSTTIDFMLPQKSDVKISVYNMEGQRICTLVDKTLPEGLHSASWDGYNENGELSGSGQYIYQLFINGYCISKKMTLIK